MSLVKIWKAKPPRGAMVRQVDPRPWKASIAANGHTLLLVDGVDRDDAAKALDDAVEQLARHRYVEIVRWSPSGRTVFVLKYQPGGWSYSIWRAGATQSRGTVILGEHDKQEAQDIVHRHAAGYVEDESC